jgi:hypothetical protein
MGNINFHTQLNFSEARWDRLLRSTDKKDATYMGFFDRIKDFLRGGVKREALEKAYDALREYREEGEFAKQENLLDHFFTLRLAMRPEFAKGCSLKVVVDQDTWSYEMHAAGVEEPIATGSNLPIGSGYTLASFQDCEMLTKVSDWLQARYETDAGEPIRQIHHCLRSLSVPAAATEDPNSAQAVLHKFGVIVRELSALGVPPDHVGHFSLDVSDKQGLLKLGSVVIAKIALKDLADLKDLMRTHATLAANAATQRAEATRLEDVVKMMSPDLRRSMYKNKQGEVRPDNKLDDSFFCRENFVGFGQHLPKGLIETESEFRVKKVDKAIFEQTHQAALLANTESFKTLSHEEMIAKAEYLRVKVYEDLEAPLREAHHEKALSDMQWFAENVGAEPTFEAWFSDGNVERCLVFSDKFAAPGVLSGEALHNELETGDYKNLNGIVQNYAGMGSKSAAMLLRMDHETVIRKQLDELFENGDPPWPCSAEELDEFATELANIFISHEVIDSDGTGTHADSNAQKQFSLDDGHHFA